MLWMLVKEDTYFYLAAKYAARSEFGQPNTSTPRNSAFVVVVVVVFVVVTSAETVQLDGAIVSYPASCHSTG